MKASVQYDDFRGTSAADISDQESLSAAAKRLGIDTSRYRPVGVEFYSRYHDEFGGFILALDQDQSSEGRPHVVEIKLGVTRADFFSMFKRINVILVSASEYLGEAEIMETVYLNDGDGH
jgi:hypothetical protein